MKMLQSLADLHIDHASVRALVVDDDPFINRLVRIRLKNLGYQVSGAGDGREAMQQIIEQPPDLLFLDVAMPEVDGLEVLEWVRSQKLDLAVVIMTAFGSENTAVEALRRGADDYLRKPFEAMEFQAVIERTVARLYLMRQNVQLRRQLETELAQAATIQAKLLPQERPQLASFEVAAYFQAAKQVGGDFYDWHPTGRGPFALTLGGVTGTAMPALLTMATVRATLRAVAQYSSPAQSITTLASTLTPPLEQSERAVTLFHGHLDPHLFQLYFVSIGSSLNLLLRADGRVETLSSHGLPLGILINDNYEESMVTFEPGDILLVYSDGLMNARPDLNIDATLLADILTDLASAQAVIDRLVSLVQPLTSLPDDITLLVVRRLEDPR